MQRCWAKGRDKEGRRGFRIHAQEQVGCDKELVYWFENQWRGREGTGARRRECWWYVLFGQDPTRLQMCKRGAIKTRHMRALYFKGISRGWLQNLNAVILSLSDEDFGNLVSGKKKAQNLFMSGKLKIKGDVMKATKAEPVLKKAQTNAKL